MANRIGSGDEGGSLDDMDAWSGDGSLLDHLLEFVAPGSRLIYEYQPTARIGGPLGSVEISPVVGVIRHAERDEFITGVHFTRDTKKCLLDFEEFVGLLKLLEEWLSACRRFREDSDRLQVKSVRFETRNGLVIERFSIGFGEAARLSVASPVVLMLSGAQLEELFRACQSVKCFLDDARG